VSKNRGNHKKKDQKMSQTPKTEIASDTYKTANANLALENAHLKNQNEAMTAEIKDLQIQLEQTTTVIENDLKADLILKIQAASEYQETDLLKMTPLQLQTIEETLAKSKGCAAQTQSGYKSIRAGNASAQQDRLTVGNLYGKTRQEIMQMEGF